MLDTTVDVGRAVRDVIAKRGCDRDTAAWEVLKHARSNGGFGEPFLLAAIKSAESGLFVRSHTYAPPDRSGGQSCSDARVARALTPAVVRFDSDDYDRALDIEVFVPGGGRKAMRYITKDDALAIQRRHSMTGKTYADSARTWGRIAAKIPDDGTLGDIWDDLGDGTTARLLK